MRPRDLRFSLLSIDCPCGKPLMECDKHRLPFFDALKKYMPDDQKGVVGPDLFSKFVDPVKAAEYALKAAGIALVFGIVWHLLSEGYQLGFKLYREGEEEASPAENSG